MRLVNVRCRDVALDDVKSVLIELNAKEVLCLIAIGGYIGGAPDRGKPRQVLEDFCRALAKQVGASLEKDIDYIDAEYILGYRGRSGFEFQPLHAPRLKFD